MCRQPKLCVGSNKEPWTVMEKAPQRPGPQKAGKSCSLLCKSFQFSKPKFR